MANTNALVHFDELEDELNTIMREMAAAFALQDPSVLVSTGTSESLADSFSRSYADKFIVRLGELEMGLKESHEETIRGHFISIITEFDTVDRAAAAKADDQTPEAGVNALISEHRQPIMQLLQAIDEGYD